MRRLVMALLVAFPLFMLAEVPDDSLKSSRNSWYLLTQLNLNIPGNWKSLHSSDEISMSYGGGIGIGHRIHLKYDIIIDANLSICYDKLNTSSFFIHSSDSYLKRWTVPLSFSAGYPFELMDDIKIIPFASVETTYCFSNKANIDNKPSKYCYNDFNISWGIGCGLCLYDKFGIDFLGYFGLANLTNQSITNIYDNKVRMSFKYFF